MAGLEITARLAHWQHEVVVQFSAEDAATLVADNMGRTMCPIVVDGTLVIGPTGSRGVSLTPTRGGTSGDWPLELNFGTVDGMHPDLAALPFFSVHEIQAEIVENCIHLVLPPAHQLPWPSTIFNLSAQQWQGEIARRMASAQRAGLHKIDAPSWVKRGRKREWAAAAASL